MGHLHVLWMQDGGHALRLVGEEVTGGASLIHLLRVDAVVVAEVILRVEIVTSTALESPRGAFHLRGEILLPIVVDGGVEEVVGVLHLVLDHEAHRDEGHRAMTDRLINLVICWS